MNRASAIGHLRHSHGSNDCGARSWVMRRKKLYTCIYTGIVDR